MSTQPIAISCSGNSRNVLEAVRAARVLGVRTIGLVGRAGGMLKDMVDICVQAPAELIGQQEDIHMVLDHAITSMLRQAMIAESTRIDGSAVRAMVLAAGEATRLRPLTDARAKAVLPIGGKPALEHTLEWLRSYGIHDVGINLHHCPGSIKACLGDGERLQMRLTYGYEPELLGTAGAVRAFRQFLDRRFLLVYGDVLTNLELDELLHYHASKVSSFPSGSAALTMALCETTRPTEVGIADVGDDGRILRFAEKPSPDAVFSNLANAGVLVLEPGVVDCIPPGTDIDFGRDVFPALIEQGVPMFGWRVPEDTYLVDYGSIMDYARVQIEWSSQLRR